MNRENAVFERKNGTAELLLGLGAVRADFARIKIWAEVRVIRVVH